MNRLFTFVIGCCFMVIAALYAVYEIITVRGNNDGSSKKSEGKYRKDTHC